MNLQEELPNSANSVGDMFRRRMAETSDGLTFLGPDRAPESLNQWTRYMWAELRLLVDQLAAGLLVRGLSREQRVEMISTTRFEWILFDLAAAYAAGATTMVYPNTATGDVEFILNGSGTCIVMVEDATQLAKMETSPTLRAVVHTIAVIDTAHVELNNQAISYTQLRPLGMGQLKQNPGIVDKTIAPTDHDTLSTLIYTSGITGRPKGVRLNYTSWIYEGSGAKCWKITDDSDPRYLWLPLDHVSGKALIACQIAYGPASVVDGRIGRIVDGPGEIRPTFMCGAPRIFEKVRAAVTTANTGLKGRVSRWVLAMGRDSRGYRLFGLPMPGSLVLRYRVADALVFSKLKAKLGGRMKFMIFGSTKLFAQVQEWFYPADLLIVEGHGSTETSAIAFLNVPTGPYFGSVGKVMPGIETRPAKDGGVLLRGPIIIPGCHNLLDITAEVLGDGWYHTGDLDEFDAEGNLTITDRKKDLLKTPGGKYIALQKVESAIIVSIPCISQAIAVGDRRKYCSALLVPDPALFRARAEKRQFGYLSYTELSQCPEIRISIEKQMAKANTCFERWETVKRLVILDHELTVDNDGVTPNMEIRRTAVAKRYGDIVDSLYDAEG